MKYHLIFDTETTGLIDFQADLMADHQPRICQLGAMLCNDAGHTIMQMNAYIIPDGWEISEGASKVNGITLEMCRERGIPMTEALAIFNSMKAMAKVRVAHNISFDKRLLAREAHIYGLEHNSEGIDSFCTMQNLRDVCNLAPTDKMMASGRKSNKPPTLQEAHIHFFGEEFSGAHDAMADVRACKDIYFEILNTKKEAA